MTSNELLFVFIPRLILFFFFFLFFCRSPALLLHRVFPNNLREFSRTHFLLPDVGLMKEEGGGGRVENSPRRPSHSQRRIKTFSSPVHTYRTLTPIPSPRRLPLKPGYSRAERRCAATAGQVGLLVADRCKRKERQRDVMRAHRIRSAFLACGNIRCVKRIHLGKSTDTFVKETYRSKSTDLTLLLEKESTGS